MKQFKKEEFESLVKIENNKKLQIDTVNSRDLWEYLEIKTEFSKWIQRRIKDYGFIEQEDYIIIVKNDVKSKGRPEKEYHVSIDMAKELGMTENNNLARCIRKYFIERDKQLRNIQENHHNQEWIDARTKGKLQRHELTDGIRAFQKYAEENGSKHADKYFMLITKMINKALFRVDSLNKINKNLRDCCDYVQLAKITVAESTSMKEMIKQIDEGIPYKEIYQNIKAIMEKLGALVGQDKPKEIESDDYIKCMCEKDKNQYLKLIEN
jgi:phage anti-repressor protein